MCVYIHLYNGNEFVHWKCKPWETVKDREAWYAAVHGAHKELDTA